MDALTSHSLRTKVLEEQVQLGKAVADGRTTEERRAKVFARAVLDGTDGIQQIQSLLTARRTTQARDALVARGKHQILELMAFIDKDMVDTHRSEIHHVIGTLTHGKLDILQLNLQVLLTFLQTGEHTLGDAMSLLTQDVQSFLDITKLVIENLFLDL